MNKMIMNRWQRHLQTHLPQLHAYQVRALAAFSLGAACARHCHLSRLSAAVPTAAQPHSTRRRLLRWLGNERVEVPAVCRQMAFWLGRWNAPTARLHLLLDETPLRNDLRVLKISVAYRRRALPLALPLLWCCYPLRGRDHAMTQTVTQLLAQAYQLLQLQAPQAQVVLLADRGLCWPQLIMQCRRYQWHYLLRAQGQTRWRQHTGTGTTQPLAAVAREPGQWWCGPAQVFQKAGWLSCNVVACWPHDAKEAWLLVTSLPPTLHVCRWYARRIWQEQSFRDEKSHGFCWQQSQVCDPQRVNRLLLILALAQLWLMSLGDAAQHPVWRQRLGLTCRATRRLWSRFRTGWHLLLYALHNHCSIPCHLLFTPP